MAYIVKFNFSNGEYPEAGFGKSGKEFKAGEEYKGEKVAELLKEGLIEEVKDEAVKSPESYGVGQDAPSSKGKKK